ncbi:MAG: VacB/RNase II family 3'-5' exoribonuclease, partial [Sphingomonadaceae bacterium]|nr:VacB/RNase II family 3'-5' exoribonuclease [Sphingomonadaceae bacterium]
MPAKRPPGLPTRDQILEFVRTSDEPAGKREIARAFGIRGEEKIALKRLLAEMAGEGLIEGKAGRAVHKAGALSRVTVLRVADVDDSGQAWAVPERWEADSLPPRLRVIERRGGRALGVGDRVLARTEEAAKGWIAHPMKRLERGAETLMGVLHDEGGTLWLKGLEKSDRRDLMVSDAGGAGAGDLVMAEKTGRPPRQTARVTQILGDPFAPRSFSLIAIHKHGIPDVFPEEAIAEAGRVAKLALGKREDLTHLPIVAIDPADARDHDDAVWAAPDDDPKNAGGFKAIVAIADVSFYVRPGSALDREARRRGNSVYFPDRVVPMLPEVLSADVCSLKAGEDRAALACHLVIGKEGELRSWRFTRAKVRLASNIAYEDAQAAMDQLGEEPIEIASSPCSMPPLDPSPSIDPALVESALRPLWACWSLLAAARARRAPLELDLPERRVVLDEKGRILSVSPRERLDAHRLIEDFMIAANVAAAKALEAKKSPVMYRVHEPPSREKLVALKDYLKTYGIEFALGQVVRPASFNAIIDRLGEHDARPQIMEQILRSQTQAYYTPTNAGHFGLALGSYAHFTSPIRRYADLIVHRALVSAYGLGPAARETGLGAADAAAMEPTGELISRLERRAMEAERDTIDRYVAAYLSERVGDVLPVRVTGVQPFGLFATVDGLGGDGLLLARDLGGEYFRYDEASQALIGDDSGTRYALGDRLELRLVEANPISGGLRFEPAEGKGGGGGSDPRPERRER